MKHIVPREIIAGFATGTLIALAVAPWDFYPLAFIALLPWLWQLRKDPSWIGTLRVSLWTGFFMSLATFAWVAYVLNSFAMLPWAVAIPMLLLFCIGAEPNFLLYGLTRRLFKNFFFKGTPTPGKAIGFAALLAATYTAIDQAVPKLFQDSLGHIFHSEIHMLQNADWGGVQGLTFLLVLINESIVLSHQLRKKRVLIPALVLLTGMATYGVLRLEQVRRFDATGGRQITLTGIQGNIGDFEKLAAEQGLRDAADKVMSIFQEMTDRAMKLDPMPDLIVWPETTYPSTFGTPYTLAEKIRDQQLTSYAQSKKRPILFGGYDHRGNLDYNAFFFLEALPGGDAKIQVYHKNILLQFGEELPFSETFPILRRFFPQVANFGRGPGPEVVTVSLPDGSPLRIAPIICYEALFPRYIRDAAVRGAQLIVNATNDSWFGPFGEPQLHFALTVFRSVEARLPQFRVTNSGISALILPTGEIRGRTDTFVPAILHEKATIHEQSLPTVMKSFPNFFGKLCFLITVSAFCTGIILRRRRTQNS